jgi:hypothetical protein
VKRIGSAGVVVVMLSVAAGCSEAVYTLGRLSGDASTSDAPDSNGDASGGSGAGGAGGSGGASGVGGSGGDAGVMCSVRRAAGVRKGLNLYLMVDSSFAIALQPVWGQLTQGITAFVDDAANASLGVGIQFYGGLCSAASYATPKVAVSPLPGVAAAIRTSYPPPVNGVAASIAPAVQGAATYASSLETGDLDRETDVVIFSDGLFDQLTCGSGIVEATSFASVGLSASPSIKTHVIAIDAGVFGVLTDLAPLDGLAAAGGTVVAQRVRVDIGSSVQIKAALQTVAATAQPCAFKTPTGFVAARTTIEWRASPTGAPVVWPRVANLAACGSREAIYPAPGSSYVELCPSACATFKATSAGSVQMREECP